ncbi:MAG: hypothetical protein APR54_10245 [Candidatus Cloacimonas sp. SDB]|nr:MAG: hypothetical protein APR54_10245 [Candidatus Cloacimonas sp. SDB]
MRRRFPGGLCGLFRGPCRILADLCGGGEGAHGFAGVLDGKNLFEAGEGIVYLGIGKGER